MLCALGAPFLCCSVMTPHPPSICVALSTLQGEGLMETYPEELRSAPRPVVALMGMPNVHEPLMAALNAVRAV